jgi:hypothetical protein
MSWGVLPDLSHLPRIQDIHVTRISFTAGSASRPSDQTHQVHPAEMTIEGIRNPEARGFSLPADTAPAAP